MDDIDDILASEPPSADDRESHKAEVRKQFMTKLWFEALKSRTSAVEPAAARPEAREPPPPPPQEPTAGDAKGEAERRLTRTCREPGAPPASDARAELAKLFRDHGVLCLLAAAPPGLAAECRAASAALLDEVLALVPARDAGDGSGVFAKELVLRSPGRYDLLHGVSARAGGDAGGADDARGAPFRAIKAAAQGAWMPLMRTLLGPACYLIASGCVISCPGASEQSLHRDGKHLFDDDDERDHVLPPHCITVRSRNFPLPRPVLYGLLRSKRCLCRWSTSRAMRATARRSTTRARKTREPTRLPRVPLRSISAACRLDRRFSSTTASSTAACETTPTRRARCSTTRTAASGSETLRTTRR